MRNLRVAADANQYYLTWQSHPVDKKLSPTSRQTASSIFILNVSYDRAWLSIRLIDFSIKFQAARKILNFLYVDTPAALSRTTHVHLYVT